MATGGRNGIALLGRPALSDSLNIFDVTVVGGGVVGCAVARHLAVHTTARVALVEARGDVCSGTSKANTAILHTGFDAVPGSLESRLVARGYHLLRQWAPIAGVTVESTGALLVAWDDEQAEALPTLAAKAAANGYDKAEVVDADTVRRLEPHLGHGVRGGMLVPDEHIIDPWATPLGFVREAIASGASVLTGFDVSHVELAQQPDNPTLLHSNDGSVLRTRFVVNAAGLRGDHLHRMFGQQGFSIRPRRGELIVFDKLARPLVHRTILPVPTSHTKGVLIAPTVFGNVMLGPTADDIDDIEATATTRTGLDGLIAKAQRILPDLLLEQVTATYAGLRAATEHSDYQLSAHADLRYVCLGGIRSTGLTASMALGEEAARLLADIGLEVTSRPVTSIAPSEPPAPTTSHIVCHCERVEADVIAEACRGALPATDLDGLRRRTRATNGRCQGFACLGAVAHIASTTSGRPMSEWLRTPEATS